MSPRRSTSRAADVGRRGRKPPHDPHDRVIRLILGNPENAAAELRAVVSGELARIIDWSKPVTLLPGSFLSADMEWSHTDLLLSASLLNGRDAFIYALVEHQSTDRPEMIIRMLRYICDITLDYRAKHPGERSPAVIPVIIHQGPAPWVSPLRFTDLLNVDEATLKALGPIVPRFESLLDDLAVTSDDDLRARRSTPEMVMVLRLLREAAKDRTQLLSTLQESAPDLRAVVDRPDGTNILGALLLYADWAARGIIRRDQLQALARTLGERGVEAYMTVLEELRAEFKVEGRAETLVDLLTKKFGRPPRATLDIVYAATRDQLKTWTDRFVDAESPEQVFGPDAPDAVYRAGRRRR